MIPSGDCPAGRGGVAALPAFFCIHYRKHWQDFSWVFSCEKRSAEHEGVQRGFPLAGGELCSTTTILPRKTLTLATAENVMAATALPARDRKRKPGGNRGPRLFHEATAIPAGICALLLPWQDRRFSSRGTPNEKRTHGVTRNSLFSLEPAKRLELLTC